MRPLEAGNYDIIINRPNVKQGWFHISGNY